MHTYYVYTKRTSGSSIVTALFITAYKLWHGYGIRMANEARELYNNHTKTIGRKRQAE